MDTYLFLSGSLTAKIISSVYWHCRNKRNSPLPLLIFSVSAFIFRKVVTGLQEQHSCNFCWSMGRPQGGKISHARNPLFISWTRCHCTDTCTKRRKARARVRAHLQLHTWSLSKPPSWHILPSLAGFLRERASQNPEDQKQCWLKTEVKSLPTYNLTYFFFFSVPKKHVLA